MARRLVDACESVGLLPAIISADQGVLGWVADNGLASIPENGKGLSQAAEQGVAWARDAGLEWVVIHSDLPLISPEDLVPLMSAIESGRDVIAPSHDGGTSALSSSTPMRFSYGPGSFHAHLRQLADPVVLASLGLLHDIDSESDLESAAGHERGKWLGELGA